MKRAALFVACLLLCIIGLSVVPVEAKKILPGPGMVSLSIHLNSPTGPTIDSYLHFKMSNFAYDMIPYDEGGLVSRTLYAVNNSTGNITIGPLTAMHGFPNMTFSGGNVVLAPNQNTPFQFTITPNEIGRFWEMFSFTHNAPNLTSPLTLTTDPKVVPKPEANPCVCCNCLAAMNNASIFTHSKEPAMYDVKLASGSHITGFPILDLGEKTDDVSYNLGPCPPGESWTPGGMGSGSAYIIYHRCDPLACPDNMESGFLGENMRDNFDMAIFQDDGVRGRVMTPDMRQYLITRPSGSSQWDLPDGFFSDLTLNTGTSEWELRHYSGTTFYFDAPGPMMGEGRLKRITDAVGNTTTVNRNANGEKISIVNDLGRAITFTHTGGRITTITDFLNVGFSRRWDFAYDGNGNLQTITYPQAETVTNAGGTATIAAGVLVHDADGASATSIATVGGTPLAITATYRRRLTLLHGSGALNKHLTGVTDDRGATPWTASYNATTGRIVTKTINGNLVRFYFEGDTIPAQYVPDAIGGADFLGKLESTNSWTRIVDREENICDWEIHGATGNPVNGEGKFGTRRKICWTERGKTNGTTVLHSETLISGGAAEPNFWETRYFHDCNCLAPAQLTQAYRSDQAVSYDANQMPTNYPREVLVYNDNRQILDYRYKGFLASEEIHWSATYRSSDGRMETYTPPRDDDTNPIYSGLSFTHNYGYDGEGNRNSHTFPPVNTGPASGETASESWVFNGDGQMTSHTDENGNITLYTYDTNAGDDPAPTNVNQSGVTFVGFLISTTAGASGSVDTVTNLVTQYKVNALGWTTRMTDPKGFNHTMIYNNLGEVIRRDEPTVTLPETGTTSTYATHFFHDGAGNMVMSARTNEDFNDTARPNPFLNASAAFNVVNNVTMSRVEVDASAANDLTTEYAYDKNDQQTIVRLPEGNRTFVLFDERRLPFKTFYGVEPGIAINTGYPTLKTATTLTVNFVGLSRPTWDARYNTIRVRDGRGNFSDSFPDFYNRTLATRDANGNGSRFEFDDDSLTLTTSSGQISTSGAITSTLERTYHRFDERQRRYQTVLDFDLGNNEFNFSDPSTGTGSVNSNYLTEFDPGSRVMTSLDANGNPTDYVYDAADRTREVTDALGDKVIYTLDLNSNVTEIREQEFSDAGGSQEDYVTQHMYDEENRRIETHIRGLDDGSLHIDHATKFFYDSAHYTRKVEDAETGFPGTTAGNGRITESDRDDLSRTIETRRLDEDGGNIVIRNRFVYDKNSRKTQDKAYTDAATPGGEQITKYGFDTLDRLRVTVYPDSDDTITITGGVASGGNGGDGIFDRVEVSYDANTNVTGVTEQRGVGFVNTFDIGNRMTRQDITLAGGAVGETRRDFVYDRINRITFARNDYTEVERQYDSLSRLTNEIQSIKLDGTGFTGNSWAEEIRVFSGYDKQSNRTDLEVFDGVNQDLDQTCTFDALNRSNIISADYFNHFAGLHQIMNYDYHGPWRIRKRTYGNGAVDMRFYDAKRRVRTMVTMVGANVLTGFQYGVSQTNEAMFGYDKVDNPLAERWVHDGNKFDNYSYNSRYEVTNVEYRSTTFKDYRTTAVGGDSFAFDSNYNRTNATFSDPFGNQTTSDTGYAVNNANEYTGFSRNAVAQTPVHDRAGNMTGIPARPAAGADAGNDVMATASFDAFNRVFEITAGVNATQHMRTDAFGRRVAQMELSGSAITSGRRYLWDGWSCVTEEVFDGAATLSSATSDLERIYVNGASIDEPILCAIDGNVDGDIADSKNTTNGVGLVDAEYYYLTNRMGSVMGLLDADNNLRVLEYYRYSAFGEVTVLPVLDVSPVDGIEDTPLDLGDNNTAGALMASAFGNTFTYTARRLDEQTGLMFFRYRYYEPRMGRFVARDPESSPVSNLYSYCLSRVTQCLDPLGLAVKEIEPGQGGLKFGKNPVIPSQISSGHFLLRYVFEGNAGDVVFQDVSISVTVTCPSWKGKAGADKWLEFYWNYTEWFRLKGTRVIDAREMNLEGILKRADNELRGENWPAGNDRNLARTCACRECKSPRICAKMSVQSYNGTIAGGKVITATALADFGVTKQSATLRLCGSNIPISSTSKTGGFQELMFESKDVSAGQVAAGAAIASHTYEMCADVSGDFPRSDPKAAPATLTNHTSSGLSNFQKGVKNLPK